MKKLLLNVLPEQCYPLEGQIIIRDTNDRIEMIGRFHIDRYSDIIHCNYDINHFYPKLEKVKEKKTIYISCDQYPQNHKYELIAKTHFEIDNVEINNVFITGLARIDPAFKLSLNKDLQEFTVDFQPIFKDEHYFDMQVW